MSIANKKSENLSSKILNINDINDRELWEKFIKRIPQATPFHSISWAKVLSQYAGIKTYFLVIEENNKIVAGLPVSFVSLLKRKKIISIPYTSVGAILGDEQIFKNLLLEKILSIAKQEGAESAEIRLGDKWEFADIAPYHIRESWITFKIAISTPDYIWNKLSYSHQKNIKQAKKRGIEIYEAESENDWLWFAKLEEKNSKQRGIPGYGYKFFSSLRSEMQPDEVILLIAKAYKEKVGAILLLCNKKYWVYKLGECEKEKLYLRPFNALIWEAMLRARKNGVEVFDLGSTSLINEGTINFKKGWGTSLGRLKIASLSLKKHPTQLEKYADNKFLKFLWSKLPMGLTEKCGAYIRKWLC